AIAREFSAWTYVDDAHATGVLGAHGRGSAEHCGVEGEIDVIMGTLGKAVGTIGAFVCGSSVLIEYLMNRARSFIFTTASPPAFAVATLEALRIVNSEPERRTMLRSNARYLRARLSEIGHSSTGEDDGYIVPIVLGESERTTSVGNALREAGYLVGAVRPPTVPMGQSRLRITVSAAHARHIWHPYTQHLGALPAIHATRASGAFIHTADGRRIFDAISSWWVTLHGHSHPAIVGAITRQAAMLDQIIFTSFTHEPAALFARDLVAILPEGLNRVFFSDDGSTAVEVAVKMALQYHANRGSKRSIVVALENAYHGDTFGAMSVSGRGTFT